MSGLNNTVFYAALMLVAGLGIPAMAALNSGLGQRLGNLTFATTILFVVGGLIVLGYLLVSSGVPSFKPAAPIPVHFYFAGILFVFYILSISWVAPKFGIGNAIAFVLLGQLISMTVIDHFSLFGAIHQPISIQRLGGLLLMVAGIFLAVRRG